MRKRFQVRREHDVGNVYGRIEKRCKSCCILVHGLTLIDVNGAALAYKRTRENRKGHLPGFDFFRPCCATTHRSIRHLYRVRTVRKFLRWRALVTRTSFSRTSSRTVPAWPRVRPRPSRRARTRAYFRCRIKVARAKKKKTSETGVNRSFYERASIPSRGGRAKKNME